MAKPKLLDLYCCQGGASKGYVDAGFDVVGVDIAPQPHYPFEFRQGDAIEFVKEYGHKFDAIHASCPCQLYSVTHHITGADQPDLIQDTREAILPTDLPYVIENVVNAHSFLASPTLLCGAMFGLETYRHRLFETNWDLTAPPHPKHEARTTKMGRAPVEGEYMHIVGNFSGVAKGRDVMGMPWATRDGLREAIPPAYAEHIGKQLIEQL